jgi:predicted component of type VI protein secretion system
MLFVRDSQLDLLEAAWRACAAAVTPAEVTAAADTYQAAVMSSRAEEVKEFQAKRAPHIRFRDE